MPHARPIRLLPPLAAALLLSACASRAPSGSPSSTQAPASPSLEQSVGQAALTPLNDLNLVRAEIPAPLKAALAAPYATPADRGCPALAAEVMALDAVLGADLDLPATDDRPGLVERGSQAAGQAATRAVRSAAEGLVPYRGWVRKLTGAERYAKEVQAAIAAGTIRRAYLKGLGQALACRAPAAPFAPSAAASAAPAAPVATADAAAPAAR